jgi:type I restriction enzyme S subunit
MAKTLYNNWFVQFDFPDANGKPYKSSGGKMVYNPTLKREIPAGWEAATLATITPLSNESLNQYPCF